MKFCQLIEYNMRKNFFEKPYRKYDGETIPRLKIEHVSVSIM